LTSATRRCNNPEGSPGKFFAAIWADKRAIAQFANWVTQAPSGSSWVLLMVRFLIGKGLARDSQTTVDTQADVQV